MSQSNDWVTIRRYSAVGALLSALLVGVADWAVRRYPGSASESSVGGSVGDASLVLLAGLLGLALTAAIAAARSRSENRLWHGTAASAGAYLLLYLPALYWLEGSWEDGIVVFFFLGSLALAAGLLGAGMGTLFNSIHSRRSPLTPG